MRLRRLLPVLVIPIAACNLYFGPPPSQEPPDGGSGHAVPDASVPDASGSSSVLTHVTDFAGEGTIGGITAGAGNDVWIAYRRQVGGYYDPDVVSVVKYDGLAGHEVQRFTYTDQYLPPQGLAWDGAHLWINYADAGLDNVHVAELDAATGAVVRTFAAPAGIHDLGWDGQHLLLSDLWNQVIAIDPSTGQQVSAFGVPQFMASTLRGLTWRQGAIWVGSQADNRLLQLGPDGHLLGAATTDLLDPSWNYAQDLYLAAVGEHVALVIDSHVWVLGVAP